MRQTNPEQRRLNGVQSAVDALEPMEILALATMIREHPDPLHQSGVPRHDGPAVAEARASLLDLPDLRRRLERLELLAHGNRPA